MHPSSYVPAFDLDLSGKPAPQFAFQAFLIGQSPQAYKYPPEEKETILGHAEVRAVFRISKVGNIAGCLVTDGEIHRNSNIRVIRDNEVLFTGKLSSLKRHQENAQEVRFGFECGIGIKDFNDIEEGDILECFIIETTAPVSL